MDRNLLTYWQYGVDTEAFRRLLKELNVKHCTYLYEHDYDVIYSDNMTPINIFSGLSFFKNANIKYEIDEKIMMRIAPFERTAMDVINRWHRSYLNKDDYASVEELYLVFLRFWYDFIIKNNINLLIITIMPHIPMEYIPYIICKCLDIPTIIQGLLPLTDGEKTTYILQPEADEFDANLLNRYHYAQAEFLDSKTLDNIPLNIEIKRYFNQYSEQAKNDKRVIYYNQKNSIADIYRTYSNRIKLYISRNDYKVLLKKIWYLFKVRIGTFSFLKKVTKLEEHPNLDADYYIFALHLQPEATTLPAGGIFRNQLLAIRIISKLLPSNCFLYVKEHPSYWIQKGRLESVYESRTLSFYNEIKSLRNVKLIDHSIPSTVLIDNCKAVVTVTGTIGFEALFRGKPVLSFGETFYSKYPMVYRIRTIEDCENAINEIKNGCYSFNSLELAKYLYAIQKYAIPMGMNEKEYTDNGIPKVNDEDRDRIVDKIIEFCEEYYKG